MLEFRCGFSAADRRLPHRDHVARIERRRHVDHAHAGRGIPREDRPLHGRCSPMPRQERAVEVDAAIRCDGQRRGRKNLAVVADHEQVGAQGRDRRDRLGIVDPLGSEDRHAGGLCHVTHRIGRRPPARRRVRRPRDNSGDRVRRLHDRLEHRHGERARAHHHDFQGTLRCAHWWRAHAWQRSASSRLSRATISSWPGSSPRDIWPVKTSRNVSSARRASMAAVSGSRSVKSFPSR